MRRALDERRTHHDPPDNPRCSRILEHVPKLTLKLEHRLTTLADVGLFVSCRCVPIFQDFTIKVFHREFVYKEGRESLSENSLCRSRNIGTSEHLPCSPHQAGALPINPALSLPTNPALPRPTRLSPPLLFTPSMLVATKSRPADHVEIWLHNMIHG